MPLPRYSAKRDASEQAIVKTLLAFGFSVYRLDQPVDLLVGFRGVNYLVEVKTAGTQYGKKLNANQQDFNDGWNGLKAIKIDSVDGALEWVMSVRGGEYCD